MWADPLPTTWFAWIQKASLIWAGHMDASVFVCCIFLVIHNLFRTNPVQSQNKDSMFSHSNYRPFPRAITQDYKNAYNAFKKEGKTAASLFGKQELCFCWDLLKRNIIRFCFVLSPRNLCMSKNYSNIQGLGYARVKMSITVPFLCPMFLKIILLCWAA